MLDLYPAFALFNAFASSDCRSSASVNKVLFLNLPLMDSESSFMDHPAVAASVFISPAYGFPVTFKYLPVS
jgi:hypothetical protein